MIFPARLNCGTSLLISVAQTGSIISIDAWANANGWTPQWVNLVAHYLEESGYLTMTKRTDLPGTPYELTPGPKLLSSEETHEN
jgi:hypothetical protein